MSHLLDKTRHSLWPPDKSPRFLAILGDGVVGGDDDGFVWVTAVSNPYVSSVGRSKKFRIFSRIYLAFTVLFFKDFRTVFVMGKRNG
jgi:hypothetical protein